MTSKIRILISEDSRDYRKFLISLLCTEFEIEVCPDVCSLIDLYTSFSPHIILMDMKETGSEDLGIISYIRNQANDQDVFILALSGTSSRELMVKALNAGANDFIFKTFVKEELMARLEVAKRQIILIFQLHQAYQRISREIDTVANLQDRLLPKTRPHLPGISLDWYYLPSGKASGDYYDFFQVGDGILRFVVADVSGHGARAAFIMNTVRTIFRISAKFTLGIDDVVRLINEDLKSIIGDEADFVTLVACDLDPGKGRLRLVNAGHCPALILTDMDRTVWTHSHARPLGFFDLDFEPLEFSFQKHIKILLFTDGFFEWEVAPGQLFGIEKFSEMAVAMLGKKDFCLEELVTRLESIPQMRPVFRDDLTAMVVEYHA